MTDQNQDWFAQNAPGQTAAAPAVAAAPATAPTAAAPPAQSAPQSTGDWFKDVAAGAPSAPTPAVTPAERAQPQVASQPQGLWDKVKSAVAGPDTALATPMGETKGREFSGLNDLLHGDFKEGGKKIWDSEKIDENAIAPGSPAEWAIRQFDPDFHGKATKEAIEAMKAKNPNPGERPMIDIAQFIDMKKHPTGKALTEIAQGFTSPENVAIMYGTGGLGLVGKTPQALKALGVMNKLISAGFAYQALQGAYEHSEKFRDAFDSGDASRAQYEFTHMLAGGVIAAQAGTHAIEGTKIPGTNAEVKPLVQLSPTEQKVAGVISSVASHAADVTTDFAKDKYQATADRVGAALGKTSDFDEAINRSANMLGKKAGPDFRKTVGSVSEDLKSIINNDVDNKIVDPKSAADAIDQHLQQNIEKPLQEKAGATRDETRPVVDNFGERAEERIDKFFDDNRGKYGSPEEVEAIKQRLLARLSQEQDLGNGVTGARDPNLYEAENIRQGLNKQAGSVFEQGTSDGYRAASADLSNFMREVIDQGYDERGVGGVKEARAKEAKLIDVADALRGAQGAYETQESIPGIAKIFDKSKTAGILGAIVLGHLTGPVGALGTAYAVGDLWRKTYKGNTKDIGLNLSRAKELAARNQGARATTPSDVPPVQGADVASPAPLLPNQGPSEGPVVPNMPPPPEPPAPVTAPAVNHKLNGALASFLGVDIGQVPYDQMMDRYQDHAQKLRALIDSGAPPETPITGPDGIKRTLADQLQITSKMRGTLNAERAAENERVEKQNEANQKKHASEMAKYHVKYQAELAKQELARQAGLDTETKAREAAEAARTAALLADERIAHSPVLKALDPAHPITGVDGHTAEQAAEHEHGHILANVAEGLEPFNFLSESHSDAKETNAAAAIQTDVSGAEKGGKGLAQRVVGILGGPAFDEVHNDISLGKNSGARGDIARARQILREEGGLSGADLDKVFDALYDRAKEHVSNPEALALVKANAPLRETGLHEDYHMSPGRLKEYVKKLKGVFNGTTPTTSGVREGAADSGVSEDEPADTGAAREEQNGPAARVPSEEARKADEGSEGKREQEQSGLKVEHRDNAMGGDVRLGEKGQKGYLAYSTEGKDASVRTAMIEPDARGKGYGQQMYEEAANKLRDKGVEKFHSDPEETSEDAARVWDKLSEKHPGEITKGDDGRYTWDLKPKIEQSNEAARRGAQNEGTLDNGRASGAGNQNGGEDVAGREGQAARGLGEARAAQVEQSNLGRKTSDIVNTLGREPVPHDEVLDNMKRAYGTSTDATDLKGGGAAFLTPDGKFIHLPSGTAHTDAITEHGGPDVGPHNKYDNRPAFLNDTDTVRMHTSKERAGDTLAISVPQQGVNAEQVEGIKKAVGQAVDRNGNLRIERSDISADNKHTSTTEKDFPRVSDVEPMLRDIGAHPDQKVEQSNLVKNNQVEEHEKNGGSTFTPEGRNLAGADTHAVAAYPERGQTVDQLTPENLAAFKQKNADVLADGQHAVGTWKDPETGKTALDIVKTVANRDEAVKAGQDANQKAIYNLKTGETIPTGGTGEAKNDAEKYLRTEYGTEKQSDIDGHSQDNKFIYPNGDSLIIEGGPDGEGDIAHASIAEDAEKAGKDFDSIGLVRTISHPDGLGVEMDRRPTESQLASIGKMAQGDHIFFDFTTPEGKTISHGDGSIGDFRRALDKIFPEGGIGEAPVEQSNLVKGSSVPLMENPLKVKGTGEKGKISTLDVAKALNEYSQSKNPALEPGTEGEKMVDRAKKIAEDEAKYQLAQGKTGTEWYTTEMKDHDKALAGMRPEVMQGPDVDAVPGHPAKLSLFKAAEAVLSSGQKPYGNFKAAVKAWDAYNETGEFPRLNPATGKSWGPRGEAAYGNALDMINKLVQEKGEKGAADWLLSEHPVSELKEYNTGVKGKKTDTAPGAMILGEKRGPFMQNLHGIESAFTADMWVSRTWNRWMGTMEFGKDKDGVEEIKSDAPRNGTERQLMKQSFEHTANKLGLSTSSLQAVLWYYEQALYGAQGIPKESWSFRDAAQRAAKEEGATPESEQTGFNYGENENKHAGVFSGLGQKTDALGRPYGKVEQSNLTQSAAPAPAPTYSTPQGWTKTGPTKATGLITPGNIDLTTRPVVKNDDGTHSSEYSTSFQDEKGREVIVPTIVDGKFLTPDGKKPAEGSQAEKDMKRAAWQHYLKTGQHLGIYDTADHADAAATAIHNRPQK